MFLFVGGWFSSFNDGHRKLICNQHKMKNETDHMYLLMSVAVDVDVDFVATVGETQVQSAAEMDEGCDCRVVSMAVVRL